MTRLWVKICGLRERDDVAVAAAAGADAVGLVFHAPSPRNVSLEQARALRASVPAGVECVAVFLHPSQSLVDAVLGAVAPDWLQADADDLATLQLPARQRVLPVFRSGAVSVAPTLSTRCLFESGRSGIGERADWVDAERLAHQTQLVLAGGLDAANVAEAVRAVRPFGVDVSSGVERARGVKDAARIREFIRAARDAERARPVKECR